MTRNDPFSPDSGMTNSASRPIAEQGIRALPEGYHITGKELGLLYQNFRHGFIPRLKAFCYRFPRCGIMVDKKDATHGIIRFYELRTDTPITEADVLPYLHAFQDMGWDMQPAANFEGVWRFQASIVPPRLREAVPA